MPLLSGINHNHWLFIWKNLTIHGKCLQLDHGKKRVISNTVINLSSELLLWPFWYTITVQQKKKQKHEIQYHWYCRNTLLLQTTKRYFWINLELVPAVIDGEIETYKTRFVVLETSALIVVKKWYNKKLLSYI